MVIPPYFLSQTWEERLNNLIKARSQTHAGDFAATNASRVMEHLTLEKSLRVVFNLGAYALLNYLRSNNYQNIYEQPVIGGQRRVPSETRMKADTLMSLNPASEYYFCALASGGTGIRYYGEYCAVIQPRVARDKVEKVLDRNSYDLLTAPLCGYLKDMQKSGFGTQLIDGLTSRLTDDTSRQMLAAKVMQHTPDSPRLLTSGAIADAVLSDEDYCEAYHRGKIYLDTLEEIREHPADVSREGEILQRLQGGETVRCEEIVWTSRRRLIRNKLQQLTIPRSVSADSGRSGRWA